MDEIKKICLFLLIGLFLIQPIIAVDLKVQKLSDKGTMIFGLEDSAIFKINVTNNGPSDNFSLYTFFGKGFEPKDQIRINSGKSKIIELKIFPRKDFKTKGNTIFSYFIQGSDKTEVEEKLIVNLIELKDAFEIGASSIDPESNSINVFLKNKVNFNFKNLQVHFSSPFFELNKTLNLNPNERKDFKIDLKKEDFSKLIAGFYTLSANFKIKKITAEVDESIDFIEKNLIKKERRDYGLIILTTIIKSKNEGNAVENSRTNIQKNILSRIFTSFSPEPTLIERKGFKVNYVWDKKLNPGESFEVSVKTNWIIPFLIILLIILTVVLAKKYSKMDLLMRKRVSFVNAKGGEFALKVMIHVEARKFVENVKILDRLPPLVKVYEKFGGEFPKRFNKTKRIFEWELGNLEAGEKRMLSYIIYSKVGVLGRFALPSTISIFEKDGKIKEVSSNKAFFLADQKED